MAYDLWKSGLKYFEENAIFGSAITAFGMLCGDVINTLEALQQTGRGITGRRNDGYSVSTYAPR